MTPIRHILSFLGDCSHFIALLGLVLLFLVVVLL